MIELAGNVVVERAVDRLWNLAHKYACLFAGIERLVVVQFSSRDRTFDARTRGEPVNKEIAPCQRLVARLVVHVQTIAAHNECQDGRQCRGTQRSAALASPSVRLHGCTS